MLNLTADDRDDLLQDTPEGAYRVACSIIALIMRVGGELLVAGRAVSRISHRKAHADSSTHPNSSYGTRSKATSLSTPNLLTLQHSVSPTTKVASHWSSRALFCLPFDPTARLKTALRPLPREESGLLRGRRRTCLRLVHLGGLQK